MTSRQGSWSRVLLVAVLVTAGAAEARPSAKGSARRFSEEYAYGGARFTDFIADSFEEQSERNPQKFYDRFEKAYENSAVRYPAKSDLALRALLQWKRTSLSELRSPRERAEEVRRFSEWLHRMIKTVIPKFSLERGFEFRYTVEFGERQCFLQSVLVAGLLQAVGEDAGVVMVSRNLEGHEVNNAHAVAVARLTDGTDVIIDCSDPVPFVRQLGLFMLATGYRYVEPQYQGDSGTIVGYRTRTGKHPIANRQLRSLDRAFLRSQFYYYRGERAPGGIFAQPPTKEGLEDSARFLRESVRACPQNPLAVYMLGRVYLRLDRKPEAKLHLAAAHRLYSAFGFLPPGPAEAYALVTKPNAEP
jgi:hypothetical protein